MPRFLAFRLLQSMMLLAGVTALVFAMVRMTGDPTSLMMARESTPEQRAAFRAEYGFDDPIPEQFFRFVTGLLRGDLGRSLSLNIDNAELISQRVPATFELSVASLILSISISLPLGIISGLFPRSTIDYLARGVALAGQSIPSFWLAMILIIVFAVKLRMLPSFGRDDLDSIILPSIALGIGAMGQLVRITRSAVLEIRAENFIRTAHAKGLSGRLVAQRHVLPNVLIPLISVIGIQFTYLLGGSIYIETIFAWPGLGRLLNDAITNSDYPLVQAITIFIALFAISINFLTDLLYAVIDPRIRLD